MDCKDKIKELPTSPGVYLFKDDKGEVLYIGKARNLRKRVSSYFRSYSRLSERIELLVSHIRDISHIPTSTEAEALIYENSLIKQFSPRYNVALKDDKSYPLLKLTVNEKFPRLFITRIRKEDGSLYFGPYTNVKLLRAALGILKRIFPLRTCARLPRALCLNYHIKQCLGPCAGKVSGDYYTDVVNELKLFLEGRHSELLMLISERMTKAALEERYEEAANLRDRIQALTAIKEDKVSYRPSNEVEELRSVIGIQGKLDVIEAFDVSNIMGKSAVGSMIYFYKGRPRKSEYKRFRIRSVFTIDDYAMMRELIRRRYKRILEEKALLPDLIIIDGGRGHLNAALEELQSLGLSHLAAIGIAKEYEHIYMKDKKEPVVLPGESKTLHLLKRIRDEAHRFAITYHKRILSKGMTASVLDNIPGLGPKRKRALIKYFGSIDGIKAATLEGLSKVDGMSVRSAKNIIEYFNEK